MIFLTNIPADAPPLHIHTAIQAIKTYGRYPIAAKMTCATPLQRLECTAEGLEGSCSAAQHLRATDRGMTRKSEPFGVTACQC